MADHLNPFVFPVEPRVGARDGRVDLYLPDTDEPRPAVVLVHGGPVPAEARPTPRDWPVFQGYGALLAARGAVGVTVDHRLHTLADYPQAAADIADAVAQVRAHPRVDPDRVALWFFSGGSPLLAEWLSGPPPWLRVVAASYALLACPPGHGDRFQPPTAVAEAGALPIVLTRVGLEYPVVAPTVEAFVAAAEACGANLEIIDVPHGRHAFDVLDDTDESRAAIGRAVDAVLHALT